ncbi:MAG TPA: nucleotidyltransferase domain-containing protein [Candidatus Saccharimonadales bacterium]|nr:nucleotidyltransferase domain-containing protein [Candidatus Saccharimonadales bacterium]
MNTQQQVIDEAKRHLENLYTNHKDDGILAIYIWGSVTRSDFDPATSDIDVICIVSDNFDKANNEKFREELTASAPGREWGFQIIFLDELNGGPIQSRLAQAMSPQSVLPTFPSWVFVCGNSYDRADFKVKDATIPERMKLNIGEIRTRLDNIATDTPKRKLRDRKGVVKACLLLIYNRQLLRSTYFDLDYTILPQNADEAEKSILNDLLKIKQLELYEDNSYQPFVQKITEFADMVEAEVAQS